MTEHPLLRKLILLERGQEMHVDNNLIYEMFPGGEAYRNHSPLPDIDMSEDCGPWVDTPFDSPSTQMWKFMVVHNLKAVYSVSKFEWVFTKLRPGEIANPMSTEA